MKCLWLILMEGLLVILCTWMLLYNKLKNCWKSPHNSQTRQSVSHGFSSRTMCPTTLTKEAHKTFKSPPNSLDSNPIIYPWDVPEQASYREGPTEPRGSAPNIMVPDNTSVTQFPCPNRSEQVTNTTWVGLNIVYDYCISSVSLFITCCVNSLENHTNESH